MGRRKQTRVVHRAAFFGGMVSKAPPRLHSPRWVDDGKEPAQYRRRSEHQCPSFHMGSSGLRRRVRHCQWKEGEADGRGQQVGGHTALSLLVMDCLVWAACGSIGTRYVAPILRAARGPPTSCFCLFGGAGLCATGSPATKPYANGRWNIDEQQQQPTPEVGVVIDVLAIRAVRVGGEVR